MATNSKPSDGQVIVDHFFKKSLMAQVWKWGTTTLLVLLLVWAVSGMLRSIMGWWLPAC